MQVLQPANLQNAMRHGTCADRTAIESPRFSTQCTSPKTAGSRSKLARNLGLDLPLARATKEQYDRMIATNTPAIGNFSTTDQSQGLSLNVPDVTQAQTHESIEFANVQWLLS
jgi:hypothetical protein